VTAQGLKTYFVTGASRGLGRELVKNFCERGDIVVGCSRSQCDYSHPNFSQFKVDVSDEQSVRKLFFETSQAGLEVDILVNNAGQSLSRMSLLTDEQSARSVIDVNFLGSFFMMREAIKSMKRTGWGRIINFSSINVLLGSKGSSIYTASKAGLESLSHSMSREVADEDITINSLGLSLVDGTGMVETLSEADLDEKNNALIKNGFLDVEEVVHAIDFFSSPYSRHLTNQTIYFGGLR